jgi:hypothetical protein
MLHKIIPCITEILCNVLNIRVFQDMLFYSFTFDFGSRNMTVL